MLGNWEVVSKKAWVWRLSERDPCRGNVGRGVCKEYGIIGRKLVSMGKQDEVGRKCFAIAGSLERGSIQQDTLEETRQ